MIQVGLQQICKARSAMSAGRAGHWRFMRSMRPYLGGMAGPGRRSGQRPGRNGAFKRLASGPVERGDGANCGIGIFFHLICNPPLMNTVSAPAAASVLLAPRSARTEGRHRHVDAVNTLVYGLRTQPRPALNLFAPRSLGPVHSGVRTLIDVTAKFESLSKSPVEC